MNSIMNIDISRILFSLLTLPRYAKILIAIFVDATLCVFSTWCAFFLRMGEIIALSSINIFVVVLPAAIGVLVFHIFGLYREIFRYSGFKVFSNVGRAIFVYGLLYSSVITAIGLEGVPRTVGVIQPLLLLLLVGLSRVFVRQWLGISKNFGYENQRQVLIYGAGASGRQLASAVENSAELRVLGFLDDDQNIQGQSVNGLPIYSPNELTGLVSAFSINDVYLAMPNLNGKRRQIILSQIREHKVSVRTLPSITDLAQGKVSVSDLRDLDIDELLGREPVRPIHSLMSKNITHKTVLVTGAGGSIGSELCKQIIRLKPRKLLLLEQNELALYEIHKALESSDCGTIAVPLLASVQNETRLREIMRNWQPHTVYHAAAYKHVPLVEQNIAEGMENNVLGTMTAIEIAIEQKVENFVLISTDKAVRPTNIMGASKRFAEMLLQARAAEKPFTILSMVRFGNVLGSSGSVVLRFREQISHGGPVTLTHPDVTRFFMTVSEAAQLVIQAGAMATGGDVFVLDMGKPVKIIELARRIIELSGMTIKNKEVSSGDVEIKVVGLRPGEKLFEELLISNAAKTTIHPKIMRANEDFMRWDALQKQLSDLREFIYKNDIKAMRSLLERLVSGYVASEQIVDLVHLEENKHN